MKPMICSSCRYPPNDWYNKKGKKFGCSDCFAEFVTGVEHPRDRSGHTQPWYTLYQVFKKGEIPASREERTGAVWQEDTERGKKAVYLTCPQCCQIHKIRPKDIHHGGYVEGLKLASCTECDCGMHFWPYLEGWKE